MKCRYCNGLAARKILDLANQPLSNGYLALCDLSKPEKTFPLRVFVCENCFLVQTQDYASADEVFTSDYAYFSSTSESWLLHAKNYFKMVVKRFGLNNKSNIIEIASNDGYLLKNFVQVLDKIF